MGLTMTKEEAQAVRQVLMHILMGSGTATNIATMKHKSNIGHIGIARLGFMTMGAGPMWNVTEKGKRFILDMEES